MAVDETARPILRVHPIDSTPTPRQGFSTRFRSRGTSPSVHPVPRTVLHIVCTSTRRTLPLSCYESLVAREVYAWRVVSYLLSRTRFAARSQLASLHKPVHRYGRDIKRDGCDSGQFHCRSWGSTAENRLHQSSHRNGPIRPSVDEHPVSVARAVSSSTGRTPSEHIRGRFAGRSIPDVKSCICSTWQLNLIPVPRDLE
jgi:hypothetical protein